MRFLLAFLITLSMALPAHAGTPVPQLWNCMQIGFLNNEPVLVISDIQNGSKNPGKHYKTREVAFTAAVKKQWNLRGAYAPMCQDFVDDKEAVAFYYYIVGKASAQGITVYPMEFKWSAKTHGTKKSP